METAQGQLAQLMQELEDVKRARRREGLDSEAEQRHSVELALLRQELADAAGHMEALHTARERVEQLTREQREAADREASHGLAMETTQQELTRLRHELEEVQAVRQREAIEREAAAQRQREHFLQQLEEMPRTRHTDSVEREAEHGVAAGTLQCRLAQLAEAEVEAKQRAATEAAQKQLAQLMRERSQAAEREQKQRSALEAAQDHLRRLMHERNQATQRESESRAAMEVAQQKLAELKQKLDEVQRATRNATTEPMHATQDRLAHLMQEQREAAKREATHKAAVEAVQGLLMQLMQQLEDAQQARAEGYRASASPTQVSQAVLLEPMRTRASPWKKQATAAEGVTASMPGSCSAEVPTPGAHKAPSPTTNSTVAPGPVAVAVAPAHSHAPFKSTRKLLSVPASYPAVSRMSSVPRASPRLHTEPVATTPATPRLRPQQHQLQASACSPRVSASPQQACAVGSSSPAVPACLSPRSPAVATPLCSICRRSLAEPATALSIGAGAGVCLAPSLVPACVVEPVSRQASPGTAGATATAARAHAHVGPPGLPGAGWVLKSKMQGVLETWTCPETRAELQRFSP